MSTVFVLGLLALILTIIIIFLISEGNQDNFKIALLVIINAIVISMLLSECKKLDQKIEDERSMKRMEHLIELIKPNKKSSQQ